MAYKPTETYTLAQDIVVARGNPTKAVAWFAHQMRQGIAAGFRPEQPTHNAVWIRVKMVRR